MEAMFTILPNPLAMRSGANACAHQNAPLRLTDRKSTRLNSSHLVISYAVFCLKKKNENVTRAGVADVQHKHSQPAVLRAPSGFLSLARGDPPEANATVGMPAREYRLDPAAIVV